MINDHTAYFDESYTHSEPLVYTIAGYVATDIQWKKFKKEWRKQLSSENIDFFHMVDFQACKPPYGNWSKEKRIGFLQSLHKIIHKRVVRSFATTVNLDDYESLTAQQKKTLGNPHVYAAVNCMKAIGFWTARNVMYNPMAYVFEKGSVHDKDIRRLVDEEFRDEDHNFFDLALSSLMTKEKMCHYKQRIFWPMKLLRK